MHHFDGIITLAYMIDTISCATSGTEKQLLETIRRIDRDTFEPYLICLHESSWMRNNDLPCPCMVLGYKGLLKPNIFHVVRKLHDVLCDKKILILQTFFEDSIFVAWLATIQLKKKIVMLSSRRDIGLGVGNNPWYHQLFGMVLPLVNRRFDGILANSHQVKKFVASREKTSEKKIKVIYNGVNVPTKCKKIPLVFSQHRVRCWVVIVASLSPVKRHDVLIRAVVQLKNKIERGSVKFLVLGEGPLHDHLKEMVQREQVDDFFVFHGAVHNVTDFLQQCDLAVLCSDREGLSNAILEYMICGLPVIATDVGGNSELVDTSNGILIPPGNPAELANALYELMMDKEKCQRMGLSSREKAERNFSWENFMRCLVRYYERKMKEKGMR